MAQVVETMKEVRTWVIVLAAIFGTQGVSALVVPEFAQRAAQQEVKDDVSKTITALANAYNNHADHIEALQAHNEQAERSIKKALLRVEKRSRYLEEKIDALSATVSALVMIHGSQKVERYLDQIEKIPAPVAAPAPVATPVARVKIPEKAKRLPINYDEIQQQLTE